MDRTVWTCLVAGTLAVVSCGIDVDGSGAAPEGQGGTSASSTDAPSAGQGVGGHGAVDGACALSPDKLELEVSTPEGAKYGCGVAGTATGDFTVSGAVVETSTDGFTVDACSPNADCAPMLSTLKVSAPDLALAVPMGAFVRLEVHVEQPMGCAHRVLVTNLPSWVGVTNPVSEDASLWLAGADGTFQVFTDSPFSIAVGPVSCGEDAGAGQARAFVFSDADDPAAATVTVGMKETVRWTVETGTIVETWQVHDLRSYDTGIPDDDWNWAYWIVP